MSCHMKKGDTVFPTVRSIMNSSEWHPGYSLYDYTKCRVKVVNGCSDEG